MKVWALTLAALALCAGPVAMAQDEKISTPAQSEFAGRYDGSAMETAMGMILREDGTFAWGLSVGGLDLRAAGTWVEEGGVILLNSAPKPVPPEFQLLASEGRIEQHVLRVQTPGGRQLRYVDIRARCGDEVFSFYEIPEDGLEISQESCPDLGALTLELPGTAMDPQVLNLEELGWTHGMPLTFEFQRNDLGVADFSGMRGELIDGQLILRGGRYDMELRKVDE